MKKEKNVTSNTPSIEQVIIDASQKAGKLAVSSMEDIKNNNLISVFTKILKLETLGNSTSIQDVKTIYFYFAGLVCNEIGVLTEDIYYLRMSRAYFKMTDQSKLANKFFFQYLFRKGRNLFYIYRFKKNKALEANLKFSYYKNSKKYLEPSLHILQYCFKEGIVNDQLNIEKLRNWILLHMAMITSELNRWVEFQYYLDMIPKESRNAGYHALRSFGLDAFSDMTHTSRYDSLLNEIIESCLTTLSFDIDPYNGKGIKEILKRYSEEYAETFPDKTAHKKTIANHTKYRFWCLKNNLALNEHSIFCWCEKSKQDSLKLRTTNSHTHKKWLMNYQILIEQLKFDFDNCRLNFYNSMKKNNSITNTRTVKNNLNDKRIVLTKKSRLLIEAFKGTYSILDRIAVSLISIYDTVDNKPFYFHDFIDYIKKNVDINSKRYLVTLESIANELYHQNENGTLKEYKIWRDAIEHNYFLLVKNENEVSAVKDKYAYLQRIEFAPIDNFEVKTLHLMQLCRSSIFTLVFLLRDECCIRYFKH